MTVLNGGLWALWTRSTIHHVEHQNKSWDPLDQAHQWLKALASSDLSCSPCPWVALDLVYMKRHTTQLSILWAQRFASEWKNHVLSNKCKLLFTFSSILTLVWNPSLPYLLLPLLQQCLPATCAWTLVLPLLSHLMQLWLLLLQHA